MPAGAAKVNGVATSSNNISTINGVTWANSKKVFGVGPQLFSSAYGFNDQTSNSTSISPTGNGWAPTLTHSSWINGPAAVKNYKNGGKWSSGSQTPINGQPSQPGATNITGWKCDHNATGTLNSGPNGAHNGSGGHDASTSTKFVYTEVSSGRHSYQHIMRTPGINFSTSMADTDNNMLLEFYVHARGLNMGILTIWIDDASTSNSQDATPLAQFSGSHSGTAASGTTTLTAASTNHSVAYLDGTANGSATWTGTGSDWVKVEVKLNEYKTVNSDHYIYFVYTGSSSYHGDLAVDDVFFVEKE